jgi:hypothetical protein
MDLFVESAADLIDHRTTPVIMRVEETASHSTR